jgi:hypothetical protein
MLYLIFLLADLAVSLKSTPDALVIKKADIELNHLILDKNSKRAADFYSNDFILTTSSGAVKYKQDMINEIASPEVTLIVNETLNVEVRIAGSTAVLTGTLHQKGSYRGKFFDHWFLVTDTWTETPSGWKILSGHASRQSSRNKT